MNGHTDPYTIIAHLVNAWPSGASSPALDAARAWLKDRDTTDVRTIASDTLTLLDALLRALEGGAALDGLLSTREALVKYVNREPGQRANDMLRAHFAPAGGVTLIRNGQHFTIGDEELEQVRDAVNTRRREMRKAETAKRRAQNRRS